MKVPEELWQETAIAVKALIDNAVINGYRWIDSRPVADEIMRAVSHSLNTLPDPEDIKLGSAVKVQGFPKLHVVSMNWRQTPGVLPADANPGYPYATFVSPGTVSIELILE